MPHHFTHTFEFKTLNFSIYYQKLKIDPKIKSTELVDM